MIDNWILRKVIDSIKAYKEPRGHGDYWEGFNDALDSILSDISKLQEEPVSEELEEAAFDYAEACKYEGGEKLLCVEHFEAGGQWQKNRLLKDSIKTTIKAGTDSVGILVKGLDSNKYSFGDKVKLIIIKQEEE